MKTLHVTTPFTQLKLYFSDSALVELDFEVETDPDSKPVTGLMQLAQRQLQAYAQSASEQLDLPLEPAGTVFQQRVWEVLRAIPVGRVRTYGDIARELGSSARAVGNACRANPIPLFIPCHRVVAKSGIGGFAGQTAGRELAIKTALLRHEGVEIPLLDPM
ncbi:MAG: MGMT family protein [Gammaproteobacteria bacterium]|nr:MGMT family protein [Gammaproteobacteria bacterium]